MPEKIFLKEKFLGREDFLTAAANAEGRPVRSAGEELLAGKSQWITLLGEVLPRALLAELGLPPILLGSSGGGQFLVVLSGEMQSAADAFLTASAAQVSELSSGLVQLVWASTDNLGDWAVIRRRLNDQMEQYRNAPLQSTGNAAFQPFAAPAANPAEQYFAKELGAKLRETTTIGWSPENPGKVMVGEGKHTWAVT